MANNSSATKVEVVTVAAGLVHGDVSLARAASR